MTDFRRFPDSSSRQLISFPRFMELTGNKIFLCLDKGVIEIAKYLLNTRGSWRTTYVKEYVGTIGYNMPTEEEFEEIVKAIAEANIDMASCEDISSAINGVRDAILSAGSSSGCGCIMGGDTDLTETSDISPQSEPSREGPPPSGNSTWEEYEANKCAWIHKLLDDYISTLRNYGGLFGMVGGLTVAVIVGLTLVTVPPLGLAILMAALGSLLLIDVGAFAYFTQIADELQSDENLLCELYNSTDTDEMRGIMYGKLTTIIPALPGIVPPIEASLIEACNSLMSNEMFSQAINNGGTSPEGWAGSICDCGGGPIAFVTSAFCEATILEGEFSSGEEVTLESCVSGAEIEGNLRHQVAIQTIAFPVNARMEILDISSGDYGVSSYDGSSPVAFELFGSAAATVGYDEERSALQIWRWTENVTTVPFTVTLKVTELP